MPLVSRAILLTSSVRQRIMHLLFLALHPIKISLVGFSLCPHPMGSRPESSFEERVSFSEYSEAALITREPPASSPPALAIEGGTLQKLSLPVHKSKIAHVLSVLSMLAFSKAASMYLQTHPLNPWKFLLHIPGSSKSLPT